MYYKAMGVKNFMELVKKYNPDGCSKGHYKAAIFDGNNLFFMKIAGVVSRLYKKSPLTEFNGFNENVIDQLTRIIEDAKSECLRLINYALAKDNVDEVYLVFDPVSSPEYTISKDMMYYDDMTLEDSDWKEIILGDEDQITFNIKRDEQNKRATAQKGRINRDDIAEQIDSLELTDAVKDELQQIALQSNYFNTEFAKLMSVCIAEIYKCMSPDEHSKIHFIQSIVEADLTIRNLADHVVNKPDDPVLILSADTDYCILFADCPNVYWRSLHVNSSNITYHPHTVFRNLLKDGYSYDAVIRISPLMGNDYTVHEGLISKADDINNALALLNVNKYLSPKILMSCSASKIRNMACAADNEDTIKALSMLKKPSMELSDSIIYNGNELYFKRYMYSILVYKNIKRFDGQYAEFEMSEDDVKHEYNCIQNLLQKRFNTLYAWNYVDSIQKPTFLDSITVIEFDYNDENCLYNMVLDNKKVLDAKIVAELPEMSSDSE